MAHPRPPRERAVPARDDGFSLVEVVVAVVILVTVMAAVSVFFISSISTSATLQRRDAATQLADEAMELVRAVPPVNAVSVSSLIKGRRQADVQAQWTNAPPGLQATTPLWDPSPLTAPVVPLRVTKTVGQQSYDIDTFIGQCRLIAATNDCTNAQTTGALFYRVVVRVSWNPGEGADCSGGPCEFILTTVVNNDNEALFNTSVDAPRPVANPDTFTGVSGQPITVNVLPNDTGTFSINPVAILGTGPVNGTLTGTIGSGQFTYTSAVTFSGTETFQYQVTDTAGLTSDAATVTITVTGAAFDDAATATFPNAVTINAIANDTGRFNTGTILITSAPTLGTAIISGNGIVYTPLIGRQGTDTFQYRNTAGTDTATANVRVTVTAPAAATAASRTICVNRVTLATATARLADYVTGIKTNGTYSTTPGQPNTATWNAPVGPAALDLTASVTVIAKGRPGNGNYPMGYTFRDAWGTTATGTVTFQVKNSC